MAGLGTCQRIVMAQAVRAEKPKRRTSESLGIDFAQPFPNARPHHHSRRLSGHAGRSWLSVQQAVGLADVPVADPQRRLGRHRQLDGNRRQRRRGRGFNGHLRPIHPVRQRHRLGPGPVSAVTTRRKCHAPEPGRARRRPQPGDRGPRPPGGSHLPRQLPDESGAVHRGVQHASSRCLPAATTRTSLASRSRRNWPGRTSADSSTNRFVSGATIMRRCCGPCASAPRIPGSSC